MKSLCVALLGGAMCAEAARLTQTPDADMPPPRQVSAREGACRHCYRKCPIACFVGTCGFGEGFEVKKFKITNQCYTCEVSASVGIAQAGDFSRCTDDESLAINTYTKVSPKLPASPGVKGDVAAAASGAEAASKEALTAAQRAADQANTAALAAQARVFTLTSGSSEQGDLAQEHRLAVQIRAAEAERTAEAAAVAMRIAGGMYQKQLIVLRKEERKADIAEDNLSRAEAASRASREKARLAEVDASEASRQEVLANAQAGARDAQAAAAAELKAVAEAAQTHALEAVINAKKAAEKAALAATIAAVPPQPEPTVPPCDPKLGAAIVCNQGSSLAVAKAPVQATVSTQQVENLRAAAAAAPFDPSKITGVPADAASEELEASLIGKAAASSDDGEPIVNADSLQYPSAQTGLVYPSAQTNEMPSQLVLPPVDVRSLLSSMPSAPPA